MVAKFLAWQTRTRNKILCAGLIYLGVCAQIVLIGWLLGRDNAPAMILALTGPGGLWGGLNAVAIAWEKRKPQNKPD